MYAKKNCGTLFIIIPNFKVKVNPSKTKLNSEKFFYPMRFLENGLNSHYYRNCYIKLPRRKKVYKKNFKEFTFFQNTLTDLKC